jgi:REP element-mobilizing transposase RayT
MPNHFHLVLQTPNANSLAGMRWLSGACTLRLNHRHKPFGHLFSGCYKALLVGGNSRGYLSASIRKYGNVSRSTKHHALLTRH